MLFPSGTATGRKSGTETNKTVHTNRYTWDLSASGRLEDALMNQTTSMRPFLEVIFAMCLLIKEGHQVIHLCRFPTGKTHVLDGFLLR